MTYRLHDFTLTVQAETAALGEMLAQLLDYLRATPTQVTRGADLTIEVTTLARVVPSDAERMGVHEREIELLAHGPHQYLRYGEVVAQLDPATGHARLCWQPPPLDPGAEIGLLFDMLALSLLVLLRPRGQYLLHAASVVHGGKGYLISGVSGSGKSTLALNLVRAGWPYLSDDMVLLGMAGGVVQARPLGRHFRLTSETLAQMPDLAAGLAAQPTAFDKGYLDVDTAFPNQYCPQVSPGILLLPELIDDDTSALEPLRATDILLHLLGQTTMLSADAKQAQGYLAVVQQLARQVRGYRLYAGRDLLNPERAAALLAPLVRP